MRSAADALRLKIDHEFGTRMSTRSPPPPLL